MSPFLSLLKRGLLGNRHPSTDSWKRASLFRPTVKLLEERIVPSPIANNDTAYAISGKPVPINVLLNDTAQGNLIDPTTVSITANASHGTTAVNHTTGGVVYTANAGFTGTDSFNYTVKDTGGAISNQATVTITIRASVLLPGFETTTFPPNDDGSTSAQAFGFTINFFGLNFTQAYINNNGNITFDGPLSTFTPFDLTSTHHEIIAPFFADVDTTAAGNPTKFGQGTVNGHAAFGVTWDGVDYFFSSTSHTNSNSFQVILIDRSDIAAGDFDFEFNYDYIQWEAGQASGGDANGLGGSSARVGFSNGTGNPGTFLELAGSAVDGGLLDSNLGTGLVHNGRNSGVLGRYLFEVRGGIVITHPPSFSNLSAPTITYGTVSTHISGHLNSNSSALVPAGEPIQVTLNGIEQDAPLDTNDDFTTIFSTGTLGVAGSPYTIGFHYAGDANYQAATDSSTLTVIPAIPSMSNLSDPTIVQGTASTVISGHLSANAGAELVPAGEIIQLTLNGITQDAALDANDDFTTSFDTSALLAANSPYTIGFSYGGDANFQSASDTSSLTVNINPTPAFSNLSAPTITFGTGSTDISGHLNSNNGGQLVPAGETIQVTVNGVTQDALLDGSDDFTTTFSTGGLGVPGSPYTIDFHYGGDANYNSASDSSTLTVTQATPTFSNLSAPTIVEGAPSTVISGHLSANAGTQLVPAGEFIQVTLNGVVQSAALDGSDNFTTTFATNAVHTAGSPYTIEFAYAGDSNFNAASAVSSLRARPFEFVTGPDAGGGPDVELWDAGSGKVKLAFMAYSPLFTGGVRVALGDIYKTGIPDIITAPGPGMSPLVQIFDGVTGQKVFEFMAFDARFMGGCFVATADFNGDGYDDIAVGADAGGGPHVKIFDGKSIGSGSLQLLASFYAYSPFFNGGVRVAAGDINGDGTPDLIAAPGPGGSPDVRVFDGTHLNQANDHTDIIREFLAYSPYWPGGVYVAAGDVNGDGRPDIITGAGPGGSPHVKVFSGRDLSLLDSFMAYSPYFNGGVRVGYMEGQDGHGLILTAAGGGGGPHVRVLDGLSLDSMDSFYAYSVAFNGGVFIGGE